MYLLWDGFYKFFRPERIVRFVLKDSIDYFLNFFLNEFGPVGKDGLITLIVHWYISII